VRSLVSLGINLLAFVLVASACSSDTSEPGANSKPDGGGISGSGGQAGSGAKGGSGGQAGSGAQAGSGGLSGDGGVDGALPPPPDGGAFDGQSSDGGMDGALPPPLDGGGIDGRSGDAGVQDVAAPPPRDAGGIDALTLTVERATPEQIALYLTMRRTVAAGSKLEMRYRRAMDTDWKVGHPLLRINPAWVAGGAPQAPADSFAGSIFDLTPGTAYDVELTLSEPGQAAQMLIARVTTRALPPAAPAATVNAAPADNLQAKFDALTPGSVLELANGTYNVTGLALKSSGSASAPIYIRGQSRAGVVLHAANGSVLQLQAASNVVLENLTLQGSGTDSGTNASSHGISFWNGATQEDVTIRSVDIRGVDMGVVASGTVRGVLVYDCDLHGNNVWTQPFIETNLTWNDDGIRLPGQGNCAFENTLNGFGDSFAVTNGVHSSAVYFYRNRITMTGDDSFEADYGTRNLAFYDNNITNAATLLSTDPIWGGPLYCFRNIVVNTMRGPFKLNNTNSGFLIYSNTIVRTSGTTGWGWVQFNNGDLRNWAYRNNLFLYVGTGTQLLAIEAGQNQPIDFTNNGWFPDGSVWWSSSGGSFTSIAAARSGLPMTPPLFGSSSARHTGDVITVRDPFQSPITLGANHLTEFTAQTTAALRSDANVRGAGVALPNITDGFTGSAPDIGAVISGRPVPRWGAMRP
jgi:Right handed beta helix region